MAAAPNPNPNPTPNQVFVYLQLPKEGGRTSFPVLKQSFLPAVGGGACTCSAWARAVDVEASPHRGAPTQASQRAVRRALCRSSRVV